MTDKIQQARRKLFEDEYVQYRQYLKRNKDGSYNEEWVDARWLGFNAALDCVEIELPAELHAYTGQPQEDRLLDADRNHTIRQCRAAIESTNLGIKLK